MGVGIRACDDGAVPTVDNVLNDGFVRAATTADVDIIRVSAAVVGPDGAEDEGDEGDTGAVPPTGINIVAGEEPPTGINIVAAAIAPAANCGENATAGGVSFGRVPPHCCTVGQRGSSHNNVGCKTSVRFSEEAS